MTSHPTQPDVHYDPLPVSQQAAEHIEMTATPPPRLHSPSFTDSDFEHTPFSTPHPPNLDDLPPGAAVSIPRFYGLALQTDGPRPIHRNSIASSVSTSNSPYDSIRGYDQSSLHALNPTGTEDIGNSSLHGSIPNRYSSPLMSESYRDDPNADRPPVSGSPNSNVLLDEKRALYASPQTKSRRKGLLIGALIAGILLLVLVVMVPVYFAVIKKHSSPSSDISKNTNSSSPSSNNSSTPTQTPTAAIVITGGDGSAVTLEDGSTFTYSNKFGGFWVQDPNDPFSNGAKAQSWSPALNETFNWGVDKIRGVNIGGWLVTEPFIVPALYEKYVNTSTPAVDEWTLTQAMAANNALSDLEDHYQTFITEEDFAQIAGAGLNFVRIPIPYWAIEVRSGEPFLPKTAWTYFLKAIQWARKYGIRINLDLHAVPGSQNGWNHSGRFGDINFLYGVSGIFNAQRTLEYVQVIAEFISQPQYKDVVVMFGVLNEPRAAPWIGQENLARWYLEAYNIVRTASGVGEGNGPFISFHDGFESLSSWAGLFPNADRVALDTHPYIAFGDQSTAPISSFVQTPCNAWGNMMNDSLSSFGVTVAGEFSLATNDCGLWVNGVFNGTRYEGTYPDPPPAAVGSCAPWNDWTTWDSSIKTGLTNFALSSMDALQNYFFWTWKVGNSTVTGKVEAPFWSYQLGLQQGWMPTDPRSATGACASNGVVGDAFKAPLASWQTGGSGAGNIPASVSSIYAWPPTSISAATDASLLPSYTPTGADPTLPAPTFTSASATGTFDAGSGWFNAQDTQGAYVPIQGCTYPDPWGGLHVPIPTAPACSGQGTKRDTSSPPLLTAAP